MNKRIDNIKRRIFPLFVLFLLVISQQAKKIINQALETGRKGDLQTAREILKNLISGAQTQTIHLIKYTQQSNHRQIIRDLLRGAEMDIFQVGMVKHS